MHLIDFIIIVALGIFIFTRFFSDKLPKDLQPKSKKRKPAGRSVKPSQVLEFPKTPELENEKDPAVKLRKMDTNFDEKAFVKGIEAAYRYYVEAWNAQDDEKLENLLAPQFLDDHLEMMEKLAQKGQTPKVDIKKWGSAKLLDARLNGRTAIVDVQIIVEQSDNFQKEDGKLVGGKAKPAKEVKFVWTLARSIDSDDPNWEVDAMTKPS